MSYESLKGAGKKCKKLYGKSLTEMAKEWSTSPSHAAYRIMRANDAPGVTLFAVKGQWVKATEAAKMLGISRTAVYARAYKGEIKTR